MEKFTPYEKLSKRDKRELDRARRGSWGAMSPVTRRPENPKVYNRKKAGKWRDAADSGLSVWVVEAVSTCAAAGNCDIMRVIIVLRMLGNERCAA